MKIWMICRNRRMMRIIFRSGEFMKKTLSYFSLMYIEGNHIGLFALKRIGHVETQLVRQVSSTIWSLMRNLLYVAFTNPNRRII